VGASVESALRTVRTEGGRDYSHIALSYVVPVYFNQTDTSTLSSLLEIYATYDNAVLDRVQFVIVDDGSPIPATLLRSINLNALLLRITKDIPWNQSGARNLGVVYARSDKILLTDVDLEIPADTLRRLICMKAPGRRIYKMRRLNPDGSERKPAPNTFVLSRGRFLRLYGYDEEFSGHYGFEDTMFCRWQRYHGTRFLFLPRSCYTKRRLLDNSRSYHSLERDMTHNGAVADQKRHRWRTHGWEAGHSRKFLNFSWEVVEDRQRRSERPEPANHPLWTKTWWWRWLFDGAR